MSTNKNRTNKPTENWHILLVEDQASMAKMTASMIKDRWQCHVTIANTFQQTKKLLETKGDAFFLTVTDLNLPDAPNGEIIKLLVKHKQPTVAITGYFDQALHETLMETGIIDYVLKKNINAYEYLVNFVGRLYQNSKTTVLVVDDSDTIRQRTTHFLKQQFLNILHAKNGLEALDVLANNPDIKLVLVDSEMPVMNGLTFTAKARQIKGQSALAIIGISGSGGKELSAQFLKHGANDFISKPFSYEELTCRVNQNLDLLDQIQKMNTIANLDYLTQLPNRRYFFETGETIHKKAKDEQTASTAGILDIDHFKQINDQYGHECGDLVLQEISQLIKNKLPDQHVSRIGGEEFGFMITKHNLKLAEKLIASLHKAIAAHKIHYKQHSLQVTASIGYTTQFKDALDATLSVADQHLYAAKEAGRNQIISDSAEQPSHKRTKAVA